ncbi:MAG: SurA N-terminal domain-containing protein [Deltaproteobacteria bacterium]|jgi:peptidyl-prolyl cis-trans isomerase D|nr:SurA N-terminal domain-containing protein [Deltaproteobacteria bacterium]
MLDLLRRKAQSPLIQGTILIIALVFIFWGVGGYRGSQNVVAQVNDEIIPYEEFQKTYERLANQYSEQFGGTIPKGLLETIDLEGQVLEQLIQRSLLRQGAREMGIMVSDVEVQQSLENMEAFRSNGVFNVELYKSILSSSGMTPTSFEDAMRTDLLAGKAIEALSRFAKLTPLETREQFNFDNEEISIEYAAFSGPAFRESVETGEEELRDYYEENSGSYLTEPQVKLLFLTFPYEADDKPAVSTEEIESFYRQNIIRYSTPDRRKARHILFKTEEGDPQDVLVEKREKAEQVLALARSGEDFAALAKQYSEGPSGPRGGDLGTFPRGRMVKAFDDAVFSLQEGEVSDIVETQFGFHVIKLEKIEPAAIRPLEEVKGEIEAEIQARKASELAFTRASEAYEKIILAGSLDKFSQNSDALLLQTDFFSKQAPAKSGSSNIMVQEPAFLNAAFSLNKGELSSLVETPLGYAIIFASDKKEAETASYEEVAAQVREDYISSRSEVMAREAAAAMLAALREGVDFAAEAARYNIPVKTTGPVTRSVPAGSDLPPQVAAAGFELSAEKPYPDDAVAANGMFYVFRVLEKKPPAPNLFSDKEEMLKTGMLENRKGEVLAAWLASLRKMAEIEIAEQFR